MPKYDHENWGDIADHIFAKGVITAVDGDNDTADVTVEGYEDGTAIPLFYHCDPDSEERPNGAIEGAAAGFSIDDEVIVMCTANGVPVRIIGFVDGIKACFGYMVVRVSSYCCVWDFSKNAMATDVYVNDDPETMAEFPVLTSQISQWIESKDEVVFDNLFSQENESGDPAAVYTIDEGISYNNSYECPGPGGEWYEDYGRYVYKTWQGSRMGLFGLNEYEKHDNEDNSFECDGCGGGGPCYWDSSHDIHIVKSISISGFCLTSLNGSAEKLDFKATAIETEISEHYTHYVGYTYECDGYDYSRNYSNTVEKSCPYFSLSGGTQIIALACSGCDCIPVGTDDPPVPTSINIGYAGYYSDNYKVIAQLFIYKDADDNYEGYGTADSNLPDISVAPSTLSEKPVLSAALKTMAEITGVYSGPQAQFYK